MNEVITHGDMLLAIAINLVIIGLWWIFKDAGGDK
jgi:hypothetical protein